jgi:CAAX prenyl protease-like protein
MQAKQGSATLNPRASSFAWRIVPVLVLLLIELSLIRLVSENKYGNWFVSRTSLADWLGQLAPLFILALGATILLVSASFVFSLPSAQRSNLLASYKPPKGLVGLHSLFFALAVSAFLVLPPGEIVNGSAPTVLQGTALAVAPIAVALFVLLSPLLVLPFEALWAWTKKHWLIFISGGLLGVFYLKSQLQTAVAEFLIHPTLDIIEQFFSWCGLPSYRVWEATIESVPIFGNETFRVAVHPACTGYEGAALTMAILAIYLFIQRSHLRMPVSLLILPIAAVVMFLMNAVRIAVLVLIGVHFSPEIAVGGFHTVAGWINLVLTVIVSVWVLERFFARKEVVAADGSVGEPVVGPVVETGPSVLNRFWLIPLAVWIASGLLTTLFTGEFRWLYPLQVLATSLVIAAYWGRLNLPVQGPSVLSIGVGLAVAVMWLAIIPVDTAANAEFEQALFSANIGLAAVWILFRVVGTAVLVPYAEELAFRGFFHNWLAAWFKNPWFALAVTSVAFGFVHSNLLAGALAGLAYGLVRMHRGSLWDAIAAHAVTNLLLALYVLATGGWSYW